MGLLDELEQEAQKRKAGDADAARRKAERDEAYRTRLEPAMGALHEFLAKLVANLRLLKPQKELRYDVPGYGEIVGVIEHEYDLKETKQPSSKEIVLSFPAAIASEKCPTVEVLGSSKVKTLAGLFQRHRLGGMLDPKKDGSGDVVSATFKAKGRITLSAQFYADAETGQLRMSFTNFDALGSSVKSFPPEQVSEALYDEIGRYLMREPNALFREELPDAYRKQLRAKVQQEEMKRKWESQISAKQQQELRDLKREHSLGGKLGKLVDQVKGATKLGGAFDKLRGLVKKGDDDK